MLSDELVNQGIKCKELCAIGEHEGLICCLVNQGVIPME